MSPTDRSAPPAAAAIRAFEFPEVHDERLANGLDLRCARLPRLPLVSAVLVLTASESSLDDAQAGLSVLAAHALEGGTGKHTAGELAEAMESIGAELHVASGWDATTVAVTCLAERLPRALELVAEVVAESTFPDAEVARHRDQQLARIRQRAMDPASLANDWAAKLFYAKGVPYGRPLSGTHESVASFGHEDVKGFAERFYRPGGGGLVLAGDVDARAVAAHAERHFVGWAGTPPGRSEVSDTPRFLRRTIHVVHRPGSVQSELRFGYPSVPRKHADYFPLIVANTVLGGSFTSRLNMSLREKHGFTYGVHSRFNFRRGPGPFSVSTSVATDVTAPAVRETLAELERFAADGPEDAEVESARDYIAGVFPLRMETTAQLAARVAELLIFDLPADHHTRYRDHVRGVTPAAAREASARHVRPDRATIVIVGDADVVRGPLEALGVGPVEVHLPTDAPASALP
jgi:predicted Zn-dependent peptidase